MASFPICEHLLSELQNHSTSLSTVILHLFQNPYYLKHPIVEDLHHNIGSILAALLTHPHFSATTEDWMFAHVRAKYTSEVKDMTSVKNGWHFGVLHARAQQLHEFSMSAMAEQLEVQAPHLWQLLEDLLTADKHLEAKRKHKPSNSQCESKLSAQASIDDEVADITSDGRDQRRTIITIRKVAVLSIFLRTSNQKCNQLQTIMGLFQHSCNTPDKVIETLANMGLSITSQAINIAINSLSKAAEEDILKAGRTLLVSYAFDNFDVDLPSTLHGLEQPGPNLQHLTSGTLLPLNHNVMKEDLRVSKLLWESSLINDTTRSARKHVDIFSLMKIHGDALDRNGLNRHDRFNAWKFKNDLIKDGPLYFQQFLPCLGSPEVVDAIPLIKTTQIPARAMDTNNSTVDGNISSLVDLLRQGGVGNSSDAQQMGLVDVSEYVVLFHGDLGTSERVQSAQLYRAIEGTAWNRLQYTVFVPGLFHLKMAAGDALWRILIEPAAGRNDPDSLMRLVSFLRPKETIRIAANYPGYRKMQEIIFEAGGMYRLECWRAEIQRRHPSVKTIQEWAESKPTWHEIDDISRTLAKDYVARGDFGDLRANPAEMRDQWKENSLLRNQYLLFYEELSWAMNAGDVGRIEACFPPWIALFKATGKHKYAKQMIKFLGDVHFVYPERLRRAIRYNILCNPTGKAGQFRAIDWLVEWNNLFTKAIYGGKYSNYTVPRIIKESPLIQIFRDCHLIVEKNFGLAKRGTRQGKLEMSMTFREIEKHLAKHMPFTHQAPRKTAFSIPDMLDKGLEAIIMALDVEEDTEGDNEMGTLELDDVTADLQM